MKTRRVVFWTTFSDWAPVASIEKELLLIEKHKGSLCIGIHCDGALERCHAMRKSEKDQTLCINCQESYLKNIVPLLDRAYCLQPQKNAMVAIDIPSTQAEFRKITQGGIDIGTAVLSTVKTDYGDDEPKLRTLKKSIKERLNAASLASQQLEQLIEALKPDAVYMFNGRQFDSRPLLRICQSKGIDYYTYEAEVSGNHYGIYHNSTPHSVASLQNLFRSYLKRNLQEEKMDDFIKQAESQQDIYGAMYREKQRYKVLPKGFDNSKTNITILHSSEDEYSDVDNSLSIWGANSFYNYLASLSKAYYGDGKVMIYVRVHPRLGRFKAASVDRLARIASENVTIISPESEVDTFALACAADLSLCYGSTAGPEAVLLGAKVVCIGECGYSNAGIMPNARTIDDLKQLIENCSRINCNQQLAAKYLAFLTNKGEPFRLSNPMAQCNHGLTVKFINGFKSKLLRMRFPLHRTGLSRLIYHCWRIYLILTNRQVSIRPHPFAWCKNRGPIALIRE